MITGPRISPNDSDLSERVGFKDKTPAKVYEVGATPGCLVELSAAAPDARAETRVAARLLAVRDALPVTPLDV